MRSFYGGTYIGKERLASSNIYHPVRLEYYKTEETKNFKTAYGIEVIKTEYKDTQVNVENKIKKQITNWENGKEIKIKKIKNC